MRTIEYIAERHWVASMARSDDLMESAREATSFLKAIANEHRLMILCLLAEDERSVGELEELLELRQPTLSQQLARLRSDDLVNTRRDGKSIHYSLSSPETQRVVRLLYELFCAERAREAAE